MNIDELVVASHALILKWPTEGAKQTFEITSVILFAYSLRV